MKILRRSRRVANLQIIFRAKLQISFEPRRRMFRTLPFVAVRQKHHEAAFLLPFVFRRGDILVNDNLRAVGKIAELRFPQHQRVLRDDRIAVFKTENALFGQTAVENLKTRRRIFFDAKFRQRRPAFARLSVIHLRVTLRKRSASRILTAQANRFSVQNQRTDGDASANPQSIGTSPLPFLRGAQVDRPFSG